MNKTPPLSHEFERYPDLAASIKYLAVNMGGVPLTEWCRFIDNLNNALEDARLFAIPSPGHKGGVDG